MALALRSVKWSNIDFLNQIRYFSRMPVCIDYNQLILFSRDVVRPSVCKKWNLWLRVVWFARLRERNLPVCVYPHDLNLWFHALYICNILSGRLRIISRIYLHAKLIQVPRTYIQNVNERKCLNASSPTWNRWWRSLRGTSQSRIRSRHLSRSLSLSIYLSLSFSYSVDLEMPSSKIAHLIGIFSNLLSA